MHWKSEFFFNTEALLSMTDTDTGHIMEDRETFRAAVMEAKFQHGQARQ